MPKEFIANIKPFVLFFSIVLSCFFICNTMKGTSFYSKTAEVKGYAETIIVSDFGSWRGEIVAENKNMSQAYTKLERDKERARAYLVELGIPEDKIKFDPICITAQPEYTPNGIATSKILSYRGSVSLQILSQDIPLLQKVAGESPKLIQEGIDFRSQSPAFFYTKVDEVKIALLKEAAKDSRVRAVQLAESGGSKVGSLKSIRQGVFDIQRAYGNKAGNGSDYVGYPDEQSVEKKVTISINATYYLE
jgi:hypothetical protein